MNTFLLALRNLLRNRRRSATTLLAMALGAISILMFGGYSRNITYGLETGFVQRSGHLQIQHRDFFLYGSGNPAAFGIKRYQEVIQAVQDDPELTSMLTVVTPMLHLSGIAGNFSAGVSRTVMGNGSVVADQARLRAWNDYNYPFIRQPLALADTAEDSAVIGTGVARLLQLCGPLQVPDCGQPTNRQPEMAQAALPDDIAALSALEAPVATQASGVRIELLAASARGAPNVAGLNVVKAEQQGVKEFDDIYIGLHLPQAQKLVYGGGEPQVTAIVLQLKHTAQLPAARARLEQLLQTRFAELPLGVQDFATLNPRYEQSIRMFNTIFGFMAVLIGSIVLFTVSNTMSMAVIERTVEIGTLRAIGLRRAGIRRLFLTEGLLLGMAGAVVGVGASLLLAALVNGSGLTWTPPGYVIAVPLNVNVWGETRLIVGAGVGLVLVAVLSALLPAARAARLAVVDALRHV